MPDLRDRQGLERELQRQLERAFRVQRQRLLEALPDASRRADLARLPAQVFDAFERDLTALLDTLLTQVFIAAAEFFNKELQFGIASERLQRLADEWADTYAPQLAAQLTRSTREHLSRAGSKLPGMPLTRRMVLRLLALTLSVARAHTIARTEVTNAVSAGEERVQDDLQRAGARVEPLWFTQLDERVCPICGPRHGKLQGDGWQKRPPVHPRCRCYVGYRIEHGGQVTILFDDDAVTQRLRQRRVR